MSVALTAPRRADERTLALPQPRGPWSERLFEALVQAPDTPIELPRAAQAGDVLGDDDLQLALYVAYELHYAALEGVDARWEWSCALLGFRAALERLFEQALAELVPACSQEQESDVGHALQEILALDEGPALSRYMETRAPLEHLLEHVIHRSAYQLKEADPHSWAIPRLTGKPKAALLEIQFDEYGCGRAERMHSQLFAQTMLELELDPSYGAYLERLPGITLAGVNLISMFGLHRRLRGALVGHLAAFEMSSCIPNRRYGNAFRRLGCGERVTEFYDEHVEADAVHESVAAWDLAGGMARAEPELAAGVLFGARALLALEARWAEHLLSCWRAQRSSLLGAGPAPA